MEIIIWKRCDQDTRPAGLGNDPTYSIDKPQTSSTVWAEPITCTVPEGYTVDLNMYDEQMLFGPDGKAVDILDDRDHPAIVTGVGYNKDYTYAVYQRLDV